MKQTLAQQCKRALWTTLVQPSSAKQESQNGRVLPRRGGEKSKFRRTNVLQPLLPKPPILLCSSVQPTAVCAFLPSAGRLKSNFIDPRSPSPLAEPSQWWAETNIVSTASCAPPNNGRPSAIISMRRPSCTSGAKISKSRTYTLVETRAPLTANSCANALNCKPPSAQNPCTTARWAVMAKRIEWTATPASARDKEQKQMEAAQQKHTEQMGVNPGCIMGRCGHQCYTRQWTTLGSQRGLFILAQLAQKELTMSEPFHPHQTLPCITCRHHRCTRCASFPHQQPGTDHGGSRPLFSFPFLSCVVLSLFLCFSLSLCFCLSVSVSVWWCGVCVVWCVVSCGLCAVCCVCWCGCCCCVWCVVVFGVWCVVWHAEKTSVCRFKTSLWVSAPRPHVSKHAGVVPVHTGTFWIYTRRFFGQTHGEEREGVSPSVLLTNFGPRSYHLLERFTGRNQVENNTCPILNHSLYLKAVQFQLSWGTAEGTTNTTPTHPHHHLHHHSLPPLPPTHTTHLHDHKQKHTHTKTHTHRQPHTHTQTHTRTCICTCTSPCTKKKPKINSVRKIILAHVWHFPGNRSFAGSRSF